MTTHVLKKVAAAAALALVAGTAGAANIVLNNVDPAGVGFNDPTPATPEGGNTGTTVGAQRLIAYQKALELWGKTLKSDVTIIVSGSFAPLSCTATSGTLAQAGAVQVFSDFPGAPLAGHWYGVALANAIAGFDLAPPESVEDPIDATDIIANFNGNVGKPGCIEGPGWYYGLDNKPGLKTDFLNTFMHEVAHGLGFQNFASEATGSKLAGLPDVFLANQLDVTTGKHWSEMTTAELKASAVRDTKVVWDGANVTANSKLVLGPFQGLRFSGTLNSDAEMGTATFGATPNASNFSGAVVLATDGVAAAGGGTLTDGCEPITANVAGKIALVDRGLCSFVIKAQNAQAAGAAGLIIANTLGRGVLGMSGVDPSITIPVAGVSNAVGDTIKAGLPGVNVAFVVDPSRKAGTTNGFVRIYSPPVVESGSSGSHFDTSATPNLLMEPAITTTLAASHNLDLTPSLMKDVGWKMESLKIGACDSGVANALPTGELMHVQAAACAAGAKTKGAFVSCMSGYTGGLVSASLLSSAQKDAVMSCAARGNP
jgi:hypothetical protein